MFHIIETSSLDTLLFRNHVTTEKIPRDNVQRRFLTFFRIFYEPPPFFDLDVDRMSLWLALPFCSRKKYLHKVCAAFPLFSSPCKLGINISTKIRQPVQPCHSASAQLSLGPRRPTSFSTSTTRVFSNGRGSG
jgi:hypothetical protein